MGPEPGEYGPVPWSMPRPATLWAAVGLLVTESMIGFITPRPSLLPVACVLTGVLLYLLLRGSKLMWWFTVIVGPLTALGQIQFFVTVRRAAETRTPAPLWELVQGILVCLAVLLLLLPQTRRFYDLNWRRKQVGANASAPNPLPPG